MANTWALCALWVGLALAATLLAIWFKISTALSEIVVGTVAQLVIGVFLTGFFGFAQGGLAGNTQWITFLAGNRRYRSDLSCRCGTRSGHLQNQMA
jgi:glutathione-regulated potassium-efflux system ancillary protein KefC